MNERPVIDIPKSAFEKILDAAALIIYAAMLTYLILRFPSLPEEIPVHFNGAGEADGWGDKTELFTLPAVGAVIWVAMTLLEKVPHIYNYINLTPENAEFQYRNARLTMNVLKNEILIFFSYIVWQSIRTAEGAATGLGSWFTPVFLGVLFGSMFFFMARMVRA